MKSLIKYLLTPHFSRLETLMICIITLLIATQPTYLCFLLILPGAFIITVLQHRFANIINEHKE